MEVINTFVDNLFGYPMQLTQNWRTDIAALDSGKEQRNQIWSRPKRRWLLPFVSMAETNRDQLVELFNRAKGRYEIFLLEDPNDFETALAECSITAIDAQVLFQLIKSYYPGETETWDENKTRIQPSSIFAPVVKVDGVTKTEGADYTLNDDTGIVDFTGMGAPGAGKVITANYYFYFPVRFDMDDYTELMFENWWDMGGVPVMEVIE